MDLDNPDDRREIITQILNYGDKKDISWQEIKKYIEEEVKNYQMSLIKKYGRTRRTIL